VVEVLVSQEERGMLGLIYIRQLGRLSITHRNYVIGYRLLTEICHWLGIQEFQSVLSGGADRRQSLISGSAGSHAI